MLSTICSVHGNLEKGTHVESYAVCQLPFLQSVLHIHTIETETVKLDSAIMLSTICSVHGHLEKGTHVESYAVCPLPFLQSVLHIQTIETETVKLDSAKAPTLIEL